MKSLLYLNKYFAKYRWMIFFGIIFIVGSNILSIFPAQIFRNAIDTVLESLNVLKMLGSGESYDSFYEILLQSFLLFGGSIIGLAILKGIFTFLMRQTVIVMSRKIEFDLKNEIYAQYQALDTSFYKRNKVGDIMNRISEDVSAVRMYIGPAIMYTVNLIVLFTVVISTMFSVNERLTWLSLLPLPVMSVLIYFISSIINKKSTAVQAQLSNIFSRAQESYSGIRIIKAYKQVKQQEDKFEEECDTFLKRSMDLVKINSLFHPVIILLPTLSTLITIYVGGIQVIEGEITYGNIAEFVIYINMLTWPVASLGWVTSLVQQAAASQTRINEFLELKPEIENPTDKKVDLEGDLVFDNVAYTYSDSGIEAIKNLSFTVKKGETFAILGKTGSGKSTLANLILRLSDPSSGKITMNGYDLKEINMYQHRERIGYVPQEVFLFSETIGANIAFGEVSKEKDREEIVSAAKKAAIHYNIQGFENTYDTMVGERGVTLSGGQKQRVSIARALLKSPALLLFDDCLSAVDTETEEEILQNIKKESQSTTCIIISHRVSSIKHADHVIVLDDGGISEEGSHQELMDLKGEYFELYQKQHLE
jgi:ATP-binding cassette, subfamily B, multidrug efflux pump